MCEISGADPGAVPGASTINCGGETGSTHIVKARSFIRYCNHRYRANFITAKTKKATRVAANRNTVIAVAAAA